MLQDASDTHHKEKDIEFVKKCSSVSQALEDSFMSLLLLFSDRNACSASTVMETEVQVDEVLQQIGGLQFTGESLKRMLSEWGPEYLHVDCCRQM